MGQFLSFSCYLAVAFAFIFVVNEAKADLAIIVDTTEHDTKGRGNLEYDLAFVKEDIYTLYPDVRIVVIQADRPGLINRNLRRVLLEHDDDVQMLYIKSHGDRLTIRNNSKTLDVYLDSPQEVEAVFGPLQDRWSRFPKVVFAGCAILEGLIPKSKEIFMGDFLDFLGIEYGALYMNETNGNLASRIFIAQPLTADAPWRVAFQKFAHKALAPIGALAALRRDRANNRGHLFRRTPNGVEVHQDNYFNAMLSHLSEEERMAAGESREEMRVQRILRRLNGLRQ